MRLKKGLLVSALAAASIVALAACAGGSGGGDTTGSKPKASEFAAGTTMAKLQQKGSITIGTKFDQPLFGLQGPDGTPVGFDVEIGKLIASNLGISADKIKWVETVSKNREPFIENGQVDIVVATYTINDERKKVISFAGPYYTAGQDLLVLKGNPEKIQSVDDVKGKSVCTVSGSTSLENIKAYTDKIITTDTYSNCLEPLRNGKVVAVTTDNVILAGLASQNEGEFEVLDKPFTSEPYGIGLKKDDTEFRTFINDVLEKSYKDGAWAKAWESTAGKVLKTPEPPKVDRY
ncbi:glutamate ABC transporter substrate-binding protein [Leifsonia sp. Root112D2]|jgi:glutamate transport system substrate-binding protein|uniref:glutamate ABC transporter substrate-binding protein n=1 Tax=Leifsonia sp. Root112D2 TaxID=1736426 RepID=UPI0006FEAAA8|nr:glutamate ABC transporter substrate-binding protein [Leifsonia sp. Root112D2]KQV05279.1 ABC transporter substrate-binding protein [Leifsonia sp. Root112D2]